MNVIITIDTEADNQWDRPSSLTTENLLFISRFQRLCDRYGFKPTYLCTYEIVRDPRFDVIVRPLYDAGRAEIGSHLHPWSNPPFHDDARDTTLDLREYPAFPSELPLSRFASKLESLTELIHMSTGAAPTSYRAGRWGFSVEHIPVLLELGYKVDCSITPSVSWEHVRGIAGVGPSYMGAPLLPYFLDGADVRRPGTTSLLEIPVTIIHKNCVLRHSTYAQRVANVISKSRMSPIFNRLFTMQAEWCRPYPGARSGEMLRTARMAVRSKLPVIEMMFHSSELMPSGSPYTPSVQSIENSYKRFEEVFSMLAHAGYKGATLSGVAQGYTAPPCTRAK